MFTVQHVSPYFTCTYHWHGHQYIWETEACRLESGTPRRFVGHRQISAPLHISQCFCDCVKHLHILTEHVVLLSAPPEVKLPTRWRVAVFPATTRNPWNTSLLLLPRVTAWVTGPTYNTYNSANLTTHIILATHNYCDSRTNIWNS